MTETQRRNPRFKEWLTTPSFYQQLNSSFHFNLDAASDHYNALANAYYTPDGGFFKDSERGIQQVTNADGLTGSWDNYRVYCNPPYDFSLYRWVEKASQRRAYLSVLLLPLSLDVAWFHDFCWPRSSMGVIKSMRLWGHEWSGWSQDTDKNAPNVLLFLKGRLSFFHPALKPGFSLLDYGDRGKDIFDYSLPIVAGPAPRGGNMLAIFYRHDAQRLDVLPSVLARRESNAQTTPLPSVIGYTTAGPIAPGYLSPDPRRYSDNPSQRLPDRPVLERWYWSYF